MDRHQPHRVERLALDRRLALARVAEAAPPPPRAAADELEETAQIGARAPPRARARGASACARWPAAAGRPASPSIARSYPVRSSIAVDQPLDPERATKSARSRTSRRTAPGASDRDRPATRRTRPPGREHPPRVSPTSPRRGGEHDQRVGRDARRAARPARCTAPPRRAGWRAPGGSRRCRSPADGPSSRARRSRTSGSRVPRARARRPAGRSWRASAARVARRRRRRRAARYTRAASARASAIRHGDAEPLRSPVAAPCRRPAARPAARRRRARPSRPGTSGRNCSPKLAVEHPVDHRPGSPAASGSWSAASRAHPRAPARPRARSNSSTSAWRKP